MKQDILFEPSPFSDLQVVTVGDETFRFRDIHLLLNERSLENLDPSALKPYLDSLKSDISSDFSIPDDDLFALCGSRYIQEPSDVLRFSQALTDKANELMKKYEDSESRKKAWSDYVEGLKIYSTNKKEED